MTRATIPVTFEETDVPELLRASLRPLMDQAAASRIELRVVTLGDVPRTRVDREKIAWAVTTLAGNGLRYVQRGEPGGALGGSVLVHVQPGDNPDEIAISIQDDGPGIPEEKQAFLFERREGASAAAGLALSLVRDIVTAHGGHIEVESRQDPDEHGTSITLYLPLRRRQSS